MFPGHVVPFSKLIISLPMALFGVLPPGIAAGFMVPLRTPTSGGSRVSARHHSTSGRAVVSLFRPSTIRWKLIRIMLVSLAIALALLGFGIADAVGTSRAAGRLSDAVHLNVEIQNLIH